MTPARMFQVAALAVAMACTVRPLPDRRDGFSGARATAEVDEVPVRGHDVTITLRHDASKLSGELLAVNASYVWILASDGSAHLRVRRDKVESVEVELYSSGAAASAGWTAAGTLATLSHGFFLVISAPLWLLFGSGISGYAAWANDGMVDQDEIGRLSQYARYPQGPLLVWDGR